MDISVLLAGIIGAVLSGTGARIFDLIIQKRKDRLNAKISEGHLLKEELIRLREDLIRVENELDLWKEKYYNTREEFLLVKNQFDQASYVIERLKEENELEDETN